MDDSQDDTIDWAAEDFGIPELSFRLTPRSRNRILTVSFFPFIAVASVLVDLYIDVFQREYHPVRLLSEGWTTASRVAETVNGVALAVSGAVLFLAAIARWTRQEASWMLTIGVAMIAAAIVLGSGATVILAASGADFNGDWRPFFWARFSTVFGALAVGYFFVAFRGLVIEPLIEARQRAEAADTTELRENSPGGPSIRPASDVTDGPSA